MGPTNSQHLNMPLDKIRDVLDFASMGIWRIILREGQKPRMTASDKMLELLGIEPGCRLTEEEVYEVWHSGINPEGIDTVNALVANLKKGVRDEKIYMWNHPKLGTRYVRCGGIGTTKDDGTKILEGYHYDVTELMATHIQDTLVVNTLANVYSCLFYLNLNKDWYTSYLNNLPFVSRHIKKTGSIKEYIQKVPEHFCLPCDKKKMEEFLDLSTLDERLKYRNSISIQFQGIIIRWAQLTFIVSDRNADGTVRHMVATVEDITKMKDVELKRMEELKENIDANRSKTMMLQNMTHEIRTPLNAMFGFSQLLCMPDGTISDEQKSEYFNYIYNSFNMLSMLIDDVMDIADAEHGNYRIQKTQVEVNKVCRSSMQMAEIRLQAGVRMYFTSEVADNYTIVSDGRRIQQLLVNILTNACKHTQKGEIHLHLSKTETPGKLTFSVTDTGEGIPEDQRKDIFERYKKANSNVQGSGLGLHICKTIAKKLDAEIKLDETYNDGARFLFIV